MKKLFTLIALLLSASLLYAQSNEKFDNFKAKTLPQFASYFNDAELSDANKLNLKAIDAYNALLPGEKQVVINKVFLAWKDTLLFVSYGTKKEIWSWNTSASLAQMIDVCDFASPVVLSSLDLANQRCVKHPWFAYVGGYFSGDNQGNISISYSGRIGFFLLKNKWDFATTFSVGNTGNTNYDSSNGWIMLGAMSKLYFPVNKTNLFFNLGGDVNVGNNGSSAGLLLGLRLYMSKGSFDVGFRLGGEFSSMGGYTYIPSMKLNTR